MCGIAISYTRRGQAEPLDLQRLSHRGPDAHGEWRSNDARVWLGHTRLAILDLSSAGAQPMVDPLTGNTIAFNGEIYNHLTLRKELRDEPHPWDSSSDTETLLVAYRVWGDAMVERLKGMFAFAIYDVAHERLFVARDRLGIKPLYYSADSERFVAASEIRALPASHDDEVPRQRLSTFLSWGACPEDDLLFPHVEVFPAGHWMYISSDAKNEVKRYWPPERPIHTVSINPGRDIRKLLDGAVEEHLLADVPVASFLSGGIDSSIITALAAPRIKGKLLTFSVGFKEAQFDESSIAQEVAEYCGTDHHRIELDEEETIEIIRTGVSQMDLPSVDALNTYIVSKKVAEQGIRVALSGLGGDELFGGYPSFWDVPKLKLISRVPAALRKCLAGFGELGRRLAELPPGAAFELAIWRRRFWTDDMLRNAHLPPPDDIVESCPDLPDDFARISWAELTRYMRHLLLRDSDQMSMAVSLELRVPFLDHDLVEFVLGLPQVQKRRERLPKALLVEACRDLLPPNVYRRPKMGFALPMEKWMNGPLYDFVQEGLREATQLCGLAEEVIQTFYRKFQQRRLHWTRIWSLVVLGHYLNGTRLPRTKSDSDDVEVVPSDHF
jgi:asparagine synthase (glutamine-hydrolysing)